MFPLSKCQLPVHLPTSETNSSFLLNTPKSAAAFGTTPTLKHVTVNSHIHLGAGPSFSRSAQIELLRPQTSVLNVNPPLDVGSWISPRGSSAPCVLLCSCISAGTRSLQSNLLSPNWEERGERKRTSCRKDALHQRDSRRLPRPEADTSRAQKTSCPTAACSRIITLLCSFLLFFLSHSSKSFPLQHEDGATGRTCSSRNLTEVSDWTEEAGANKLLCECGSCLHLSPITSSWCL